MARVFDHSEHQGTELLMLLVLADYSDDQGFSYPSVTTLALKCRTTPRHAKRLIANLVDGGELEVREGAGPAVRGGRLNLYRVRLDVLASKKAVTAPSPLSEVAEAEGMTSASSLSDAEKPEVVTSRAERGDTGVRKVVTPMSPKPSENHQKEPPVVRAKRSRRSTDGQTFKEWFEPIKIAGAKAFKPDDPVFAWMNKVGLNRELVSIAWEVFKADHLDPEKADKRQRDWPRTFRNYLRKGWIRVWFRDKDGVWRLNTAGQQIAIEHGYDPEMTASKAADWMQGAI
ncbi:helix-turn-helix domain-containing protein [Hydrogenophaga borbori]